MSTPVYPIPAYLVHWDAPEWCASAATSILGSRGVVVELTVVDNGQRSGAPVGDLLPAGVRVLPLASNRGYSGGANAALDDWRRRHPDGDLCLLGSHDLHVEPDALLRLVERALAEPDIGLLAPALTKPVARSGGVWDGRRGAQVRLVPDGPDLIERDWVSGSCILVRRACADQVGPFDERFGSYVEDVDYGLRAGDLGWRVAVLTSAEVWGLGSSSDESVTFIAANTILLGAKRGGWRGAGRGLALFGWWTAKGLLASVAVWRAPARRAVSRRYARQRLVALTDLGIARRLRAVLRERRASGVRGTSRTRSGARPTERRDCPGLGSDGS